MCMLHPFMVVAPEYSPSDEIWALSPLSLPGDPPLDISLGVWSPICIQRAEGRPSSNTPPVVVG